MCVWGRVEGTFPMIPSSFPCPVQSLFWSWRSCIEMTHRSMTLRPHNQSPLHYWPPLPQWNQMSIPPRTIALLNRSRG